MMFMTFMMFNCDVGVDHLCWQPHLGRNPTQVLSEKRPLKHVKTPSSRNQNTQVVVDTFAEYRQRDVIHLAEDLEVDLANDQKILQRMFERIDEDGSGLVSYEELVEGARKDPEFQSRLRVMDIDESDLRQLFDMIDSTGEGEIESSEFIAALSRWVHDSKTAPRFVKYNVLRSLQMQEELYETVHEQFEMLSSRLDPWFCYKRNLLNPLVISCHVVEI